MSALDQLLAGDDDDYYTGAAPKGLLDVSTRPLARSARAPGAPPTGVKKSQPNLRKTFAGIPITSVATLTSADIACPVSEPFRMDRPVLSPAGQALHVSNIRVGTKPLNVSPNPISGNVFSEQAINNELSGYTAQPGVGITFSVYNSTGATIVCSGGFLGWAAL